MTAIAECLWCGASFSPRKAGPHWKRFCSAKCKDHYHTALRRWAQREADEGRVAVTDLKAAVSSCTTRAMR